MSLLEQLHQFLEEDPNDPFTIYGLALEYAKFDPAKAKTYFDQLLENHSGYIPTYYHAGKLYERLGDATKAITVYKTGMEISQKAGNRHAYAELMGALNALLDEEEE